MAVRILGWSAFVVTMVAAGSRRRVYLYLHESVAAVAAHSPSVKEAAERLDVPQANAPATALVIGYDRRASDGKNAPSRSDTLMLVRADPGAKTISLLSLPRDLSVPIRCPGRQPFTAKINSAFVYCGETGALQTVRAFTGMPINYLITVNFRGFRQLVDRLGGVWLDIDRRYFNDHSGPTGYATIDLQPGYQRLSGLRALDFVRYRHTDSDFYRNARQQEFVRGAQGSDPVELLAVEAAAGDQGDHQQRRGGAGWRQGRRAANRPVVRRPRLRAAAGAHLPGAAGGAGGLRRPHHGPGERAARGGRVREPGRRVAEEGDRRRARREGQAEGTARQPDDRSPSSTGTASRAPPRAPTTCSRSAGTTWCCRPTGYRQTPRPSTSSAPSSSSTPPRPARSRRRRSWPPSSGRPT